MAMKAMLFVDGEYYNLKSFDYGFVTGSNANGFSSGKTRQVGLTCEIEAIRQEYFEEWAFEDHMKKYVEVHMQHTVQGHGKTRVLKCHDSFLLEFNTRFSSTSEEPMSFHLFMKSGAIEASWSTAAHVEKWSELPTQDGEATVIEEEIEGSILDISYEDNQGNVITKIRKNKDVFLVVKTENMTGKTIDIDLSDDAYNFEYNGQILENDQLLNYSVANDISRIPLKTIKQN